MQFHINFTWLEKWNTLSAEKTALDHWPYTPSVNSHNLKCKCGVQVEVPVMQAHKATRATRTEIAACAVSASARIRLR